METIMVTEWPMGSLILCSFLIPQMNTALWVPLFPILGSHIGYEEKLALYKGTL